MITKEALSAVFGKASPAGRSAIGLYSAVCVVLSIDAQSIDVVLSGKGAPAKKLNFLWPDPDGSLYVPGAMFIAHRAVLKNLAPLLLFLTACLPATAQLSADSPVGVSAGFAKLFGNIPGFSATADVQVLDGSRQEVLRTPMRFQFLSGKMRMDLALTEMKGKSITPIVVNSYKQAGLDRITSIVRLDKKQIYLVFPGVRSYAVSEMSKAEAEAAAKNLQIQRKLVASETLDGHACTQNQVIVKNAKGTNLLEAVVWNASDLQDFPVKVQVQSPGKTTTLHFTQIQMTRPEPSQFEPVSTYTKYSSPDALLIAIAQKQSASSTNRPTQNPASSSTPKTKGATKK